MVKNNLLSKKNAQLIFALIFIIVGIFSLNQDILAGILLIVVGVGISNQVRAWIKILIESALPYVKKLFGEEKEQKITRSKESASLQAGRDIKAGRDIHINIGTNKRKQKRVKRV